MSQPDNNTVAAPGPSWGKRILAILLLIASAGLLWYTIAIWLSIWQ